MSCSATSSSLRALRHLLPALALLVACAPATREGGARAPGAGQTVERRVGVMGTGLTLTVRASTRSAALQASEAAVRAVEEAEARLSTWREDTELSRLNRTPVGEPLPLSPVLASELAEALACAEETGGAFDPTVGPLVEAWGLRVGGRRPAEAALAAAQARVGWRGLLLEEGRATRRADVQLEEGAWGKGAALDRALEALAEAGVEEAVVDLGGQVSVLGAAQWVAVAHPRERTRPVVEVRVPAGSLATTGNSERGLTVDGERLGHVLDPRTGRPAPDFGSITVWSRSGARADCLSTALSVLGPRAALEWARAHPGAEVLVLEPRAGGVCLRATPGLSLRCPEGAAACALSSPCPPEDGR